MPGKRSALSSSDQTLQRFRYRRDHLSPEVRKTQNDGIRGNQREAFAPELVKLFGDEEVELFSGDEAGFEGDPRTRQRWVKRGTCPTQGYCGGARAREQSWVR